MKRLNSKGFGIVGALVVLLTVAAVGGAGWYVYQQKQNEKAALNDAIAIKEQNENAALNKINKDLKSTLKINEWGVEFDILGATDPIYKIQDGVAWISTKSHENTESCKKERAETRKLPGGPYPPYFQGIAKRTADQKRWDDYPGDKQTMAELYADESNKSVIKIGDYYYHYTHGNGMDCAEQVVNFEQAFQTLRKAE